MKSLTDNIVIEDHHFSHGEDNTDSLGFASSSHTDSLNLRRVDVDLAIISSSKENVGTGKVNARGGS